MEFDNDRPVKHAYKIEIILWILLALINPLVNIITVFPHDAKIWWFLFTVNIFILPAYIFYASVLVPKFLFEKKYVQFLMYTTLTLAVIQLLLFAVYSLIYDYSNQAEQTYFTYSFSTFVRECTWSIIYFAITTSIHFVKQFYDDKKLILALEKDNTNNRLKFLRTQLNPHFLFNTLNSIYALSLEKSDKTQDVVVKLSDLMRYLLYECNEDKVPLNKEIEFIENYIDIEKLRFKADIRFTVEGETEGIMIEPFLFIAFVENGFKHAFDNAFTNAFIYITVKIKPEQIELTVVNNTNTDLATQAKRIHGTGIRNSKTILELLYPAKHDLNIIQTDKEESRTNELRIKNAKNRLENLYPDSHTLDVILSNSAFTVSLIIKQAQVDKVHYSRR